MAWTLYLHVITDPTLHKVFIHARCPSLRCTVTSIHHYLPLSPGSKNRQAQRQLAFEHIHLFSRANRLSKFLNSNHWRKVTQFIENLGGYFNQSRTGEAATGQDWCSKHTMLTDDRFCRVCPGFLVKLLCQPQKQSVTKSHSPWNHRFHPCIHLSILLLTLLLPSMKLVSFFDSLSPSHGTLCVTAVINESKSGTGLGLQSNWLLAGRVKVRVSS